MSKVPNRPNQVTLVVKYNGEVVGRRTTHVPYTHALILQRNEEVEREHGYDFNRTDPITGKLGGVFEPHVTKWLKPGQVADAKKNYSWHRWHSGDQTKIYEIVPVEIEKSNVVSFTPREDAAPAPASFNDVVRLAMKMASRTIGHWIATDHTPTKDQLVSLSLIFTTTEIADQHQTAEALEQQAKFLREWRHHMEEEGTLGKMG